MNILFKVIALFTLILALSTAGAAQPSQAVLSSKLSAQKLSDPAALNSTLIIRNQLLGVISLKIKSLEPRSRGTKIDGDTETKVRNETLFLGQGIVNLRRGIAPENKASRHIATSLSARLVSSNDSNPLYLRLRFTRARGAGRVFEITIPLGTNIARVRQVSLRALSSKTCGLKGEKISAIQTAAFSSTTAIPQEIPIQKAAALSSTKIFTVSTDCDYECYRALGEAQANDRILEFFNTVNTIYGNDLNYGFTVVGQVARGSASTYPGTITESENLLGLFHIKAADLEPANFKHLITGKMMQNSIVGLSYVGVACVQPSYTVGYSSHLNSLLTPIIIAHEMGHNLNAIHDPYNQGIMTAVLSSPLPTTFSTFSKTEIQNYVDSLGRLACYAGAPGGVDSNIAASLSTRLSKSKFIASIRQPQGSECSVTLKIAQTRSALSDKGSSLYSSNIGTAEKISLLALNMPRIKVKKSGQKVYIWFQVLSTCSEGLALSQTSSLNVAIDPDKARGKQTLSSTKTWIRLLRKSLQLA